MIVLSRREGEVLQHLILGETQKEIATKLCLATSTVNGYVGSLLCKLRAVNTTQAVHIAYQQKILQVQEYDRESNPGIVESTNDFVPG